MIDLDVLDAPTRRGSNSTQDPEHGVRPRPRTVMSHTHCPLCGENQPLLTLAEAAARLGIESSTLRHHARVGPSWVRVPTHRDE